jgi:hypothetical protein
MTFELVNSELVGGSVQPAPDPARPGANTPRVIPTTVAVLCANDNSPNEQKWFGRFVKVVYKDAEREDYEPLYVTEEYTDDTAPGKKGLDAFAAAKGGKFDMLISEHCPGRPDLVPPLIVAAIKHRLEVGGTFITKKPPDDDKLFGVLYDYIDNGDEFSKIRIEDQLDVYRRVSPGPAGGEREAAPAPARVVDGDVDSDRDPKDDDACYKNAQIIRQIYTKRYAFPRVGTQRLQTNAWGHL